ncbi:hypothetical protein SPI_07579 [Niveomyces insectorum RCEF 264]|uniref:Uncharacterized protein n=1 Tax=Niveomyces insectorum RCEF 264 TaxID=1081102 RepID=A0A167PE95_9HYPO|nr:hypothetical protein SPI_07579 [Niveomyces insectorum RCEF 264]
MRSHHLRLLDVFLATAGCARHAFAFHAPFRASAASSSPFSASPSSAAGNSNTGLGSDADVITFLANDFAGPIPGTNGEPIFDERGAPTKSFSFTVNPASVRLIDAYLLDQTRGDSIAGSASFNPGFNTESKYLISLGATVTSGVDAVQTGTVTLTNLSDIFYHGYQREALYLQITWDQGQNAASGSSYSRNFTFVSNSDPSVSALVPSYTATGPVSPEALATKTPVQTGAAATTTPASGTATAGTGFSSGGSTAASSHKGKGSRLSGGAIAGIVVGVVAGLAIVAALIAFCLRRRRHNNQAHLYPSASVLPPGSVAPYQGARLAADAGGRSDSDAPNSALAAGAGAAAASRFVAEKDAAVDLATSGYSAPERDGGPHNPQRETDGAGTGSGVGLANEPSAHGTRSEESESILLSSTAAEPDAAARNNAGAAPAVRDQVAVLIEAHMTPEDVARLEAEERELDADIENAIRNKSNRPGGQ